MKPKIHPEYHVATITCACGAVYHVGSTKKSMKVEICSKCHPFFTGVHKLVDTGGRVERFLRKYGMTEKAGAESGRGARTAPTESGRGARTAPTEADRGAEALRTETKGGAEATR